MNSQAGNFHLSLLAEVEEKSLKASVKTTTKLCAKYTMK